MSNQEKHRKLNLICDVAFELVLVLLVLLLAMMLSKNDAIAAPSGYHVDFISLAVTFGLIIFYIVFIVKGSIKSMKKSPETEQEEVEL